MKKFLIAVCVVAVAAFGAVGIKGIADRQKGWR